MKYYVAYGGITSALLLTGMAFLTLKHGTREEFCILGVLALVVLFVSLLIAESNAMEWRGFFL